MIKKIVVAAIALVILGGCVAPRWTLGGQQYPTAEAAINANQALANEVVSRVTPRTTPLATSAVIYIPTLGYLKKHAVKVTGNASDEQINYVAKILMTGYRAVAKSVKKRNIFKNVDVRTFNNSYPIGNSGYAYTIWLEVDSPTAAQWMITTFGNIGEASGIKTPPASDVGYIRTKKILHSISRYVQSHTVSSNQKTSLK